MMVVYFRICTDNGSQFSAKRVYAHLKSLDTWDIHHERIHLASPEENGYIESFHSIMQTEFASAYEFESYEEQKNLLKQRMQFYNEVRIHSPIQYLSPREFCTHFQATKQKNLPLMKPEWKLIDNNIDSTPKNYLRKIAFVCKTV